MHDCFMVTALRLDFAAVLAQPRRKVFCFHGSGAASAPGSATSTLALPLLHRLLFEETAIKPNGDIEPLGEVGPQDQPSSTAQANLGCFGQSTTGVERQVSPSRAGSASEGDGGCIGSIASTSGAAQPGHCSRNGESSPSGTPRAGEPC